MSIIGGRTGARARVRHNMHVSSARPYWCTKHTERVKELNQHLENTIQKNKISYYFRLMSLFRQREGYALQGKDGNWGTAAVYERVHSSKKKTKKKPVMNYLPCLVQG